MGFDPRSHLTVAMATPSRPNAGRVLSKAELRQWKPNRDAFVSRPLRMSVHFFDLPAMPNTSLLCPMYRTLPSGFTVYAKGSQAMYSATLGCRDRTAKMSVSSGMQASTWM